MQYGVSLHTEQLSLLVREKEKAEIMMRYFTEEHEYVDVVGDEVTVGITEYAANLLGDIADLDLPDEGDDFIVGDSVGIIEGEDSDLPLVSPLSGSVSQVNETILEEPEIIVESPEDRGWLFKITDFDSSELDDMMTEDEYLKMVETL